LVSENNSLNGWIYLVMMSGKKKHNKVESLREHLAHIERLCGS
jgi:hypothetical protein